MFEFIRAIFHEMFPGSPGYTEGDYPDLTSKTFLITGTSTGIGRCISELLLYKNATVVLINRSPAKNDKAVDETVANLIRRDPKLSADKIKERIINVTADLSDLSTIKPACELILQKVNQIDCAIMNAGIMHPPAGSATVQGYEAQFGINVMAHQLLLDLITPLIQKSADSGSTPRVVFVSSFGHWWAPENGGMAWDFRDASKSNTQPVYAQSKAGNIYQSAIFAQDHPDMISASVHPGLVSTELSRNWKRSGLMSSVMKSLLYSPAMHGAYSVLYPALSPKVTSKGRKANYYGPYSHLSLVRKDIEKGCLDGTAKKMIDLVEKEIEPFKLCFLRHG